MKFLPIIGALLLSAAPVQAFETIKELEEACFETIEIFIMCQGQALTKIAEARVDMLCELVKQDLITTENAVKMWKTYSGPPLWNEAVNRTLKEHPNCPL